MAERRLGAVDRFLRREPDLRDPTRKTLIFIATIRARIFAILFGDEKAGDLDLRRTDPVFKLACGKRPDARAGLCAQPPL